MLDHYQKCPYCGKKTCYLILGYIGEPGGDDVRCYSCKRRWFTDWAHLTQRALDSAPPYTAEELDIITDPRRNGALQNPPSQ
ncbi:MAG: hypothetical protein BroJett011_78590 [Chloroflexota bacterium]|nr:MAG: hypothetical protein BroJett011_78590 [Chloroflexota bacterium]